MFIKVERDSGISEKIFFFVKKLTMDKLDITTPALLFSAISLIMLAFTNRFLSYAQLIRKLHDDYLREQSDVTAAQIRNLRRRLYLTRTMQVLGISSLCLCVVAMFLVYVGIGLWAVYVFGVALLLLIASLVVSIHELRISVGALDLHLRDMDRKQKK